MDKHNSGKSHRYRYAAIVLLVVFLLSGALLLMQVWENGQEQFSGLYSTGAFLEHEGESYELRGDVETFLILGLDKFEGSFDEGAYNNDRQADFLLLFILDHGAKKCTTLQLNRDSMVQMDVLGVAGNKIGTVTRQLALAHTYGNGGDVSCHNTASSVSKLLCGVKIDHYLSVTMDTVPMFNDLVGGVELTVMDDFTGIDDTLVKGQTVTLSGEQALTYVRTRQGLEDSTNSHRMERQQQYLKALEAKTRQCVANDSAFLAQAVIKLTENMVTDRSANQLQTLADSILAYESVGILSLEGHYEQGPEFMEYYVDETAVKELVIDLFCRRKEE